MICLLVTGCAPQGHIEWVKQWGDVPLYQAQAECQFAVTAATPATCYGVVGCAANQQRSEILAIQCMQAKGWAGVFVPNVQTSSYYNGPSTYTGPSTLTAAEMRKRFELINCNDAGVVSLKSRANCSGTVVEDSAH